MKMKMRMRTDRKTGVAMGWKCGGKGNELRDERKRWSGEEGYDRLGNNLLPSRGSQAERHGYVESST
jgi:hypothetical protein